MTTLHIARWQASASLSSDTAIIAFEFDDGKTTPISQPIPSSRLAAVIAVLEASQSACLTINDDGSCYVSNVTGAPAL